MRQFEIDDDVKAAAGDQEAQLRVDRRREMLKWNQAKRRQALARATPAWRDQRAIENVYQEARRLTAETGVKHEVDHIVPIMGEKVCGLHVEANLQILTKTANTRKHARFPDMDISSQLKWAGMQVISGIRKLTTELKHGRSVVGIDGNGALYRISSQYGQLMVSAIAERDITPVAIVSFSTSS